ncbi:MAG TPA: aminopeptidase P family protein [Candidatus Saccharicenans sp.]|jgi:Xaa-Pro aminopeptidase|nr:aminopeptidase P family protein [Candidatus Saccharicenans sp.]HRD01160.1 aminopeptidase P family protein [Candidatus Saccharicenans sp.]
MFNPEVYQERRKRLKKMIETGICLFPGNDDSPMNYLANTYPFRQDSSFLYFFGLDSPGLTAVIDLDEQKEIVFGDDVTIEDIIWVGPQPPLKDRARAAGLKLVKPSASLNDYLAEAISRGRQIHYLPPYRGETILKLSSWLKIAPDRVKPGASTELIKAVISLRSIKSREEVAEIEKALKVTKESYLTAIPEIRPGAREQEILALMELVIKAYGLSFAFPPIITINGQIFHKTSYDDKLLKGRFLVMDTGAESRLHYACDITRSVPVGGRFNQRQKDIYSIVLKGQEEAIKSIAPGVMFKDIHLKAARVMAEGLKSLGLMSGDMEEAVNQGAHALFFPHGLGHMVGLDVHDMENLGEDYIGYDRTVNRSQQFGLNYLRMARALEPGHVMTVEPGLYFIPALYELWKKQKKFKAFINYDRVAKFLDFGGVRIEDDVLVTEDGHRILGPRPGIPKKISDIESLF